MTDASNPVRVVAFGEIMLRLSTPGTSRFAQAIPGTLDTVFGGAEASVAISIANFGGHAKFVTALPKNEIGRACERELFKTGLCTDPIARFEDSRMGLYFYEAGINQRPGRVIYDRADSAFACAPSDTWDWARVLDGADWFVLSGITPAISKTAADAAENALGTARDKGVRVAFDVNYRSKLWNWDPERTRESLASEYSQRCAAQADLLFCGPDEATRFLGVTANRDDTSNRTVDNEAVVREVASAFPNVRWIASSVRAEVAEQVPRYAGFLWERESDRFYCSHQPGDGYAIATTVDRLGIGDAFAGALVYALGANPSHEPDHTLNAIRFATAAGCLAHSIEGDANQVSRDEVQQLLDQGSEAGRVER